MTDRCGFYWFWGNALAFNSKLIKCSFLKVQNGKNTPCFNFNDINAWEKLHFKDNQLINIILYYALTLYKRSKILIAYLIP